MSGGVQDARPAGGDVPAATLRDGELVIVTGMSGAGRTTAANVLEDSGWYVIDNLPPHLLVSLVELTHATPRPADLPRLAAVVDDLRRVVLFLSLEASCEASATTMRAAGCRTFETDTMISETLTLLDQSWAGVEWLSQRAHYLGMATPRMRYAFARELTGLVKSAHDGCFRDETQREALDEALDAWRTELAREGDETR